MPRTIDQLRRSRRRFAWIFGISLIFSISFLVLPRLTQSSHSQVMDAHIRLQHLPLPVGHPGHPIAAPTPTSPSPQFPLISVLSLLTSVGSLGGLLATTTLALRKEKREKQSADLDLELKRLDIEKRRAELGDRSGDVVSHRSREQDI